MSDPFIEDMAKRLGDINKRTAPEKKKIALIVPFKNAKAWLPRCLRSIDPRFELILVDDHSDDGTNINELAAEHLRGDAYFEQLTYTALAGVADARNVGLSKAQEIGADYITFLDADDELAPDAYDQIKAAIAEAHDAPIIQLNHTFVKPNGARWPRLPNKRGTYGLRNLPKLWASSCNKIIKADLAENIRFPDIKHGEDELFILGCLAKARRIYNSERIALYYHKDNPNSLTASTTLDDIIGEQMALLAFIHEHRDDKEVCEAVRIRQSELWTNTTYKKAVGGAK